MASIRKKFIMVLGLSHEGSSSPSKVNSMALSRGSLDSGYHSMTAKSSRGSRDALIQETTFITSSMESSPERSPRKLHKAISTTFSEAMQAFSNTVRSTTSYIYPSAGEPELPSSEWAECETPKKESRRSSIMSSIRRRNSRVTPRALEAKLESPELPQSPSPMTQERAPAIDVEIPSASISRVDLDKGPTSTGSQLLAGANPPAGSKNLWPGPTRLTVDQASKKDKQESLHSTFSKVDDPYLEEGDRFQDGFFITNSESEFELESPSFKIGMHHRGDDKGYFSELESNADVSEFDELPQASLKDVAQVSTEFKTNSPCSNKDPAASHIHVASSAPPCQRAISSPMSSSLSSRSGLSKAETLHGTAEQTASVQPPSRTSSHHCTSVGDGLNSLLPSCDYAKPRSLYERQASDVYDADAESLNSSMGSRAAWDRHRAERERRYMEIVDMLRSIESDEGEGPTGSTPSTESDGEVGTELELKRSPSKKPVHFSTPPVDLSPSKVALPSSSESSPLDSLAVPKHTVMIKFADGELGTFEAGNLYSQSFRCLSSGFTDVSENASREQLEAGSPQPKLRSRNGTPFEHSRTASFFSDITDDSCAVTTHSPSCNVPPPFPSLHVRSEPARRSPSAIDALATHGDEPIRIAGPANAGIKSTPSPFDGSGDRVDEAESNILSPKTLDGANSPDTCAQTTLLELHDLQTPSPGTMSSIQSPISNAPQETFNAARSPSLVSPSIASRKARRKLKKSSSGIRTITSAGLTSVPVNTVLQPDNSPSKRELSQRGVHGKTRTPLSESKRIAQASNQKL